MPPREIERFFSALRYFTRFPAPTWVGHSAASLAGAIRYFPAVGLLIGAQSALLYLAAQFLWPQTLAVLLALAGALLATGAMHEDGLSDTADGLGGGTDKTRILRIMKDSQLGVFGALTLIMTLLGKFSLLVSLAPGLVAGALIAGHALSRWFSMLLLGVMDYVRDDDSSKARPMIKRLSAREAVLGALCALPPLALLPPVRALAGVALAALGTFWLATRLKRHLGGYTGDGLGAVQQLAELGFYLGLSAHWPP